MRNSSTYHPKRWKWRAEWLVQSAAEALIARLPGPFVFRLGEKIGGLLWHVMGHRRRIVLKNLRIAFAGEMEPAALRVLARQSFRRSVANLISAVHTAHMDLADLEACVELENPELAETTVRRANGMLLLPPHMGNWEILSRMNRLFPAGHEVGAFYRPLNNPYLDARIAEKRRSEGTRLFSKRDSLHQVGAFLKNGGMIGILADQRAGHQGIVTSFFGRLTRSSPLPGLLIRRCKCSAIAISVRTIRPGRWSVRYHAVEEPADTAACMDAIERAMRESPVDVFWFQDRWKTYLSPTFGIRDWLMSDDARSARHPHRALIWLPGTPPEWRIPEAWRHGDVAYQFVLGGDGPPPSWMPEGALVHRVPPARKIADFQRQIARIDTDGTLPVDFILTGNPSPLLRRASRRETIHLISLPA
jgi:Kdo2-lipid IVA lauroyltransferase/acyltransferase